MRTHTLVLFSTGPNWVKGRGSRGQEHWDGHATFIDGLTDRGLLVAGGPFGDESGAINILRKPLAKDEVERLYADDPFVVHGLFVLARVVEWRVFVDNWAV